MDATTDISSSRTTTRLELTGSQGSRLAAQLDRPAGRPRTWALFAHCFTCGKDSLAAARIARRLAERGIAVLRFDFTGLGASEGDFEETNVSSNIDDLVAAADYLRATHAAPGILVGHSLGGAAALLAAERIPEVALVATIGTPAAVTHLRRHLGEEAEAADASGRADIEIGGQRLTIRRQFLEDLERHDLAAAARQLRAALLILHAPFDEIVGIDEAEKLYRAAKHPKSFVGLEGADHLLSRPKDAAFAADAIVAFAERFVEAPAETEAENAVDGDPEGGVVVEESGEGRFENRIRAGRHRLIADEPVAAGGKDSGPGPYQLLAAALGACTSMTLRIYADRERWPLDRVRVAVTHGRDHVADCEGCSEGETRRVDVLDRVLWLEGDLDHEQRRRLLEIADRCPVHRTLEGRPVIRTRLAEADGAD